MGKRVNTAKWNGKRWRIDVQKDGVRRSFYSSKKGRTGQREANSKADKWLDNNLINQNVKVYELSKKYIEQKALNVGISRIKNIKAMFNVNILPILANKKVSSLSEQDLQDVIDVMYKKGKAYLCEKK